ncbi:hypothetical protein ABKN59_000972 [Abortiporus biennis]
MVFRIARSPTLKHTILRKSYATVGSTTYVGKPPKLPINAPPFSPTPASAFNSRILATLDQTSPSLPALVEQYIDNSGNVLGVSLPYESRPTTERKLSFKDANQSVFMVAHALQHGSEHKVTICSGFALNATSGPGSDSSANGDDAIVVTCAHTLEEIRHSSLMSSLLPTDKGAVLLTSPKSSSTSKKTKSGSFVISNSPSGSDSFYPVTGIQSALHKSDLILLSLSSPSKSALRSLPVSPYPVHPGTAIRAHFVVDKMPEEEGWRPWIGGTWSKWVKGTVLGYRDFAGREAEPGTYDALSHMLFKPLPTPGSSGGPIIDEESGAVVGMMLGTRMDNRVEGVRGWGVPAETIFEMFSLPGLKLKNKA